MSRPRTASTRSAASLEHEPHRRVDRLPGELDGVPDSGPGQVVNVQGRAGETGRRAETLCVAVQRTQAPAQVSDQPPGGRDPKGRPWTQSNAMQRPPVKLARSG
jgi:hypothetical protein